VVNKTVLYNLSQNTFYYGEMCVKGEMYPHNYEPLITRDLFMDCQAVREGWNKKPFCYRAKRYLFRGFLTCAVTGRGSADTKRRNYVSGATAEWTYLLTWNPDNPKRKMWVREERVIRPSKVRTWRKSGNCSVSYFRTCSSTAQGFAIP